MRKSPPPAQLTFEGLLAETDRRNDVRARDARFPSYPDTWPEAIAYCRALIERHHANMLSADLPSAMTNRQEAHALAFHLNDGDAGILAGPEAAGCKLDAATAAPLGQIPIWGLSGDFVLDVCGMRVQIELDGIFGIGATALQFPGFAAQVVDRDAPFLSDTGFRSFLGFTMPLTPGMTDENYIREAITRQVKIELKGQLVRVSARVVALEKPSEFERGQWHFQRYVQHSPTGGEIVLMDPSWYNRSGVERVMGFCTDAEYEEFLRQAPEFERNLVRSGIHLIKFWFSVSREEQRRRFNEREVHPLKQWKLSPIDLASLDKWEAYTRAKEAMFFHTDKADSP